MVKLIRRDPFRDLFDDMPSQANDFFGFVPAMRRQLEPSMNVYQTEKDLVVEMYVPNIDVDKLNVSVEEGILKIEGSTQEEKEEKGKEYYRKEIRSGSFARAISLPVEVKEDKIEANIEKGMLKIVFPKADVKPVKKVEVKVK